MNFRWPKNATYCSKLLMCRRRLAKTSNRERITKLRIKALFVAMKPSISFLVGLFSLYYLVVVIKCSLLSSLIRKRSPEISLHSYLEADAVQRTNIDENLKHQQQFQNDFVTRDRTDYIANGKTLQELLFVCDSAKPTTWTFPHPEVINCVKNNMAMLKSRFCVFFV